MVRCRVEDGVQERYHLVLLRYDDSLCLSLIELYTPSVPSCFDDFGKL